MKKENIAATNAKLRADHIRNHYPLASRPERMAHHARIIALFAAGDEDVDDCSGWVTHGESCLYSAG